MHIFHKLITGGDLFMLFSKKNKNKEIVEKSKGNILRFVDDMVETQREKTEKSKIDTISLDLIDPKYSEGDGTFEYAMFKNKNGRVDQRRILRLFRVRSVSNYVRVTQNNSLEFKNILNNFAKSGISFVTLYAFKPGENLMICYGVLAEVEPGKTIDNVLETSKQYIDALEIKFRAAYQNIEIVDLSIADSWIFEGFHFNELSVAKGLPKPDDSLGIRTGTNPYSSNSQAGRQVGEILLKGITSKRNQQFAEGFPFLMYAVFDKLDKKDILNALNEVNTMLGRLSSSKQLSASESENMSLPIMFGFGFNEMMGESHTETLGHSDSTAVSTTDTNSTGHSTAHTVQNGESNGFAHGSSEQKGTTEASTETDGKSGGVSWIGSVNASQSHANQSGTNASTGITETESSQTSHSNSNQTGETTGVSHANGNTHSTGQTNAEAFAASKGQGQNASGAGGVSIGENSGITQLQMDYFFETAERVYMQYHTRIENSLRDGMFDYRMFILTPDKGAKVTVDELIKQSYTDIDAPYPIRIEEITDDERSKLIKYARVMAKPMTLEKRAAIVDKLRFSTFITPSEASAFNLPQVNMAGYMSSFDPVPESVAFPGEMGEGAVIGKQLNPALNMKSRYNFSFKEEQLGHMGIFSMTGQGKTVFLQKFLAEVHNKFGMNVILFDWTTNHRSLSGHLKDKTKFKFGSFKKDLSMFKYNPLRTPPGVEEASWNSTLSEILCYTMGLGDRSFRIIKKVIKRVKKQARQENKEATLEHVVKGIDIEFVRRQKEYEEIGLRMPFNEQQTFSSIKERIEEWVDKDEVAYEALCRGPFIKIEDMITGEFVQLIECKNLPIDIRPFVINSIAAGIFHYCSSRNTKITKPTYLVFEEAHTVLQTITGEEPLKINETIFETINREARNYNLFIAYVCQSPEKLPELIFDNLPIRVVLQTPSEEGKQKIISAGGRDPMRLDVDLVKWLSRQPKGTCLVRISNFTRIQDGEFVAVCVDSLFSSELDDDQFREILRRTKKVV
jgi:hypothetical protein